MSQDNNAGFTEAELRQPGHYNTRLSDTDSMDSSSTDLGKGQLHAFKKQKLDLQGLSADFAVIVLPFGLVIFSFLVLRLDGISVDKEIFAQWQNAITVLATLFPILFAAIFGRLIYQTARWSLERGTSLGSLEQLMGSRTVGGALLTQFQLRTLNPLAVSLILVWAVSPLGAQSILRMFGSRLDERGHASTVVYFDTDAESQPSHNDGGPSESHIEFLSFLGTMFGAALLSPKSIKTDSMDVWGNVKIPFLKSHDNDSWQSVSWSPKLEHHSALVGVPVVNVSMGNTTFSLESSYIDLKCYNLTVIETDDVIQYRDFDWPDWDSPGPFKNGTWYGFNNTFQDEHRRSWAIALNRFVDVYWANRTLLMQRARAMRPSSPSEAARTRPAIFANETGIEVKPAKLYFQSILSNALMWDTPGLTAYCDISQKYVESRVTCRRTSSTSQQNCTVTAQRPSQRHHAPEAITPLSFPAVFRWISKYMPLATAVRNSGVCDLALQYMDEPALDTMNNDVSYSLINIDEEMLSLRLSQVLNTYILLGQMYLRAVGSTKTSIWVKDKWNVTTPVGVVNLVEVYSVTGLWMGFCIFSCIALSASGILSVFFTHLASGPDVLGYASTLVRDSRYIQMPPETGQMGGADMTVEMRDMRVRYGFTGQNSKGQVWVGVGREKETKRIRDYLAQD
ncbi:hypothetical protein NCS55_00422400 [Fusarium keratoplasticum]|nr:hypothetical protein NCS55_00422400 [Fusarium keratoplasticum]